MQVKLHFVAGALNELDDAAQVVDAKSSCKQAFNEKDAVEVVPAQYLEGLGKGELPGSGPAVYISIKRSRKLVLNTVPVGAPDFYVEGEQNLHAGSRRGRDWLFVACADTARYAACHERDVQLHSYIAL